MIEVLRTGQYSTLQDLGRYGFRSLGVPLSGPMDQSSYLLANQIIGNEANSPVLEMSLTGPRLLFCADARIVFTGAQADIMVNGQSIELNQVIAIKKDMVVSVGAIRGGNFLYMSILGGFISEIILGSASYYFGLTPRARLEKGQYLKFHTSKPHQKTIESKKMIQPVGTNSVIEVMEGPEFHLLSESNVASIFSKRFSISHRSNRMGFMLNEQLNFELPEMISSPVLPGTVQLTKGGQLIVLMRGAQTTGGYPRILQLTERSIDLLAQQRFGIEFNFTFLK